MSNKLCRNFIKTVFSDNDFPQNSVATPPDPALNSHVVKDTRGEGDGGG